MGRLIRLGIGILVAWLATGAAQADQPSAVGRWLVTDKNGIIEIYSCGDALCGRLVWMREPRRPDGSIKRDEHNPDEALRAHSICGIDILTGFKPAGPDEWEDGRAYDPSDGSSYHAEMRIESDGTLRLRGYIGIPLLGQSRIWTRAPADSPSCVSS